MSASARSVKFILSLIQGKWSNYLAKSKRDVLIGVFLFIKALFYNAILRVWELLRVNILGNMHSQNL